MTANIWTQRKLRVGPFKYQTQVSCSWALSVKTHSSTEGSPGTCKISLKRSTWPPSPYVPDQEHFLDQEISLPNNQGCISRHLLQCCYPLVHFSHLCLHRLHFSSVLACDKLAFFHYILRNANDCQNPSVL